MEPQHVDIFIQEGALVALSQIMSSFKSHKELILNIVRILSKISLNYDALDVMNMFGKDFSDNLIDIITSNLDSNAILIRSAFVLGNLTTVYSESRKNLLQDARVFSTLLDMSLNLFSKDGAKNVKTDKKIDFNRESTEDALTKIIRLIANLLTEADCKELLEINQKKVEKFFASSMNAIGSKTLTDSEECILNIIACFTNFLFYDNNDFSIFTERNGEKLRTACMKRVGIYIIESDNEELRVESMRVLCNLSRNKLC